MTWLCVTADWTWS